jgi:signal peptidase I
MDAVARPPFSERALAWLKKEALPLLVMLGLLAAARDTLANHYVVPSGSMQPTLQPGDRVVVDMRAYGLRLPFTGKELMSTGTPQRGEVAVFDSPADGTRLIKRVAAVAGDHVQLREGHLSINGQPLQMPTCRTWKPSASAVPASIWTWAAARTSPTWWCRTARCWCWVTTVATASMAASSASSTPTRSTAARWRCTTAAATVSSGSACKLN